MDLYATLTTRAGDYADLFSDLPGSFIQSTDWATLVGFYFIAFCLVHVVIGILSNIVLPNVYNGFAPAKPNPKINFVTYKYQKQVDWNLNLTSLVAVCVLGPLHVLTFYRCFVDPVHSIEDHWTLVIPSSTHALSLQLGMSCYEIIAYALSGKTFAFYLHHILVLFLFTTTLVVHRGHGWIAWFGLVELTNIPLCLMGLFGQIESCKGTPRAISGFLLWVAYIPLRMVSPFVCYYYHFTEATNDELSKFNWVSKNDVLNKAWFGLLGVSWVIIQLLSMYWFYLITRGLLKALGCLGKKKEGGKKTN